MTVASEEEPVGDLAVGQAVTGETDDPVPAAGAQPGLHTAPLRTAMAAVADLAAPRQHGNWGRRNCFAVSMGRRRLRVLGGYGAGGLWPRRPAARRGGAGEQPES